MDRFEPGSNPQQACDCFTLGQGPATQAVRKGLSSEALHNDEELVVSVIRVDAHNVRMLDALLGSRLPRKAQDRDGVEPIAAEELDSNLLLKFKITRLEDRAHSALADASLERVPFGQDSPCTHLTPTCAARAR
jgi:hypothetical protein